MFDLLELAIKKHRERLREIACYKDLLYYICQNTEGAADAVRIGEATKHMKVYEKNRDISGTTDLFTFLINLVKDTENCFSTCPSCSNKEGEKREN